MNEKKNYVKKAIIDIHKGQRSLFGILLSNSLVKAFRPYIYVVVTARLVEELQGDQRLNIIFYLSLVGILSHSILLFAEKSLFECIFEESDKLNMLERNKVTEKLFSIPFHVLESGECALIVSRQKEDMEQNGGILNRVVQFGGALFTIIISIITALILILPLFKILFTNDGKQFIESPLFLILFIILMMVVSITMIQFRKKTQISNEKLREEYSRIYLPYLYYRERISDYKSGKEIRLFDQSPFIIKFATEKILSKGIKLNEEISYNEASSEAFNALLFSGFTSVFYLILSIKAIAGVITISQGLIYLGAIHQLLLAFQSLVKICGDGIKLKGKLEILYNLLEIPNQIEGEPSKNDFNISEIRMENITFAYPSSTKKAIDNVSLTIKEGEKLAIVGENGSGKSTFIKIICGLLPPSSGHILINGKNLNEISIKDFQLKLGVVFQDLSIFSLPVGENISCSINYDENKVKSLMTQFNFKESLDLKTFLYNDCDSQGVEISGGEAQKIAIARAQYRQGDIFILDEPTAALDPKAEYKIYTQFENMTNGKTALYISHRLSSCQFCDRIAVFHNGRLIQLGTHRELLNVEGKYKQMWEAQAKYYN